jgi:hypothetical protein
MNKLDYVNRIAQELAKADKETHGSRVFFSQNEFARSRDAAAQASTHLGEAESLLQSLINLLERDNAKA